MKFYRGPKEIADIDVDGSSIHKQTLQGIDILQFSFVLDNYVELVIGDFVNWGTDTFTINKQPSVSKLKTNEYRYNFEMESNQYNLLNVIYMLDNKTTFHLHADLKKFVTHIITNLNRVYSGFQIKGEVPTSNPKNLYFDNSNCFETLQRVCKEFNVEFSISGKVIQIKENIGTDTGLTFKFKKGLRNIEREKVSSSDVITRLYAYGGSRNIPKDYGSDKLRVEPIENNTNLFGIIEGVKVFEDIYPHREGMLTSIDSEDVCKFSDASMDFDINDHLVSKNAKLTFNTGLLAGYEFEIHSYNHSDKKFDIIAFEDENGFELPNENLKPKVGDKYVIHEIKMPQEYIDNAESELKAKATEFLQKQSLPNVTYAIKPDKTYLRKKQIELNVGDVITIEDDDFGVSKKTRIIDVTQSLADKYEYTIKVGDEFVVSYLKLIIQAQAELNAKIVTERRDRTLYYNKLRRIVLSYEELKGAIFDADGYFNSEKIKPLSIETSMLSVGAKGQQLTLSNLILEANYQNNSAKLKVSDAVLAHFTIEEQVKEWRLRGDIFDLPDSLSYYYLYAKCNKNGDLGTFLVTKEQIKTDNGGDYYHFILGVVSSAIDGVRSVSMTYGQTVINGKFIKTGVIQSQDGRMRIDLENGTIHGDVTFTSNSPAFNQMSESIQPKIDEAVSSLQFGGKNYLRDYDYSLGLWDSLPYDVEVDGKYRYVPATYWRRWQFMQRVTLKKGSYIFCGYIKANENSTFKLHFEEIKKGYNHEITTEWQLISIPFTLEEDYENGRIFFLNLNQQEPMQIAQCAIYAGSVAQEPTMAPEDVKIAIDIAKEEAKQASNAYSDAQDEQKEVHIKAYADGKVTEEEQRAIADADNKLRLAKEYAEAQDNLVKTQVKAYADGKITDAEQRAIDVAKAQAQLAKTTAEAHADNIVTEEERKRIAADEAKLAEAKKYAEAQDNLLKSNLSAEFLKNKKSIEDLNTEINGAFKDGIINQVEAKAIEDRLKVLETQKERVLISYRRLYRSDTFTPEDNQMITSEKDAYLTAHNNLVNAINTAISDGTATAGEKADVDRKFNAYNQKYAAFFATLHGMADKKIFKTWKEIYKANQGVEDLNAEINGAFKDGIIEQAEARAIEKYINTIRTQEKSVIDTYEEIKSQITNNDPLKEELTEAKDDYNNSLNDLITSINRAISDGSTTSAEKADVDRDFEAYKISYAKFTEVFQKVNDLNAKSLINDLTGNRNYLRDYDYSLGLWDSLPYDVEVDGKYRYVPATYWRRWQFMQRVTLKKGSYIFCGYIKANENSTFKLHFEEIKKGYNHEITTEWQLISIPFTLEEDYENGRIFFINLNQQEPMQIAQCGIFYGNTVREPKPAPEDYELAIQSVADKTNFLTETKIGGAAVATGTLMVGNETGATAGITGVREIDKTMEESTFLWSGANFPNRGDGTTRITNGGKLYAKDAYLSGEVEAKGGKIGDFEIQEDRIKADEGREVNSNEERYVSLEMAKGGLIFKDYGHNIKSSVVGIGTKIRPFNIREIPSYGSNSVEVWKQLKKVDFVEERGTFTAAISAFADSYGEDTEKESYALYTIGALAHRGETSIMDIPYSGKSTVDVITKYISRYNTFLLYNYEENNSDYEVRLPDERDIRIQCGGTDYSVEITIIVAFDSYSPVTIRGQHGANLLDGKGNTIGNYPFGKIKLFKGNVLKLRNINGYYYITSYIH